MILLTGNVSESADDIGSCGQRLGVGGLSELEIQVEEGGGLSNRF